MRLSQFFHEVELRDVRTARIRAWVRLCYASLGALIGGALYHLLRPKSTIDWKVLAMGLILIIAGMISGTAYDFWRVRHPEKPPRSAWLRMIVLTLIGGTIFGFLLVWVMVK